MKNGKTIILLGSCLIMLIIFSTIISPTLNATYTVTSQTRTTSTYYYSFDPYYELFKDNSENSYVSVKPETPTQTQTYSFFTFHTGTLPTNVESIIYSTEIFSGRPRTSIVSIIYKSGYYVPPSSIPVSSEPWWMKPYSSSSTLTSVPASVPESIKITEISSTVSSSKVKSSKVSEIIESSAISSEIKTIVSVTSSDEIFTASNAAAAPREAFSDLLSYWWTLLIVLVLIFGLILYFNKKPNKK